MSITGFNSIISATLSGETDIICDNLTANTITLPSGDLQTTLDNIVAGSGETGPAGADGQSVSFYAPYITTLSAGSSATVNDTITTSSNTQYHQLTFNIPRGDTGATGPQGAQGDQGPQGEQGPKGDDGSSTAATAAAVAAAASAAAAVGSAASASSSAAAAASSAASSASSAASAEAAVDEISNRATYIDVGGSYPSGYTTFNRGGSAVGIRFYNNPSDLTYALQIRNNGSINQLVGYNDFLDTSITGTLTVSSTITGNLTGSASQVVATTSTLNSDLPIPFLSNTTGAVNVLTDIVNGITYNPSSNTLTSVNFAGNLTGSASKVVATNSTTDANYNIPFLSAATGNVDVLTDSIFGMTYNPSSNVLTVEKLAASTLQGTTINVGSSTNTINMEATNIVIGNTSTNSYIDIGNADYTDTINIESATINIGTTSYLQTVNIGSIFSTVNIRAITSDPIQMFNPIDQMNGIF